MIGGWKRFSMNIFLKWHSSDEISLKTFLLKVFVGLQNGDGMSDKKP